MKRFIVLLASVAAAVVLLLPATASAAFTTNTECLSCHDSATGMGAVSTVDFNAAPGAGNVDYGKCRACHWIDYNRTVVNNYRHSHMGTCPECHTGFSTANLTRLPVALTPYGYFRYASSPSVDATKAHVIHVNGSWPQSASAKSSAYCASCHGAADCSACHTLPIAHGDHTKDANGVYKYPPIERTVGLGTPEGVIAINTQVVSSTCVNTACHSLVAAATPAFAAPSCGSCHPANTSDHGYSSVDHTATITSTVPGETPCSACHSLDLMTEHAKPTSAGLRSCATCHPEPFKTSVKPSGWDSGCEQCHVPAGPTAKHTGILVAHGSASSGECVTCHTKSLEAIHAAASSAGGTLTGCLVCHNDATSLPGKTCVSCHTSYHAGMAVKHTTLSGGCTGAPGCHPARTLPENHNLYAGPGSQNPQFADSCALCHNNSSVNVKNRGSGGPCDGCHEPPREWWGNYHWQQNHRATSTASTDCVSCHGARLSPGNKNWVVQIHNADGSVAGGSWDNCAVCHNNPTKGNLTWNRTVSECDGCHAAAGTDFHGSQDTSHAAASVAGCAAGCHEASLTVVHLDATATVGAVEVKSCLVCHGTGAVIAGKTCITCHFTFEQHYDTTKHTAVSAASTTGCASCHDKGASAGMDLAAVHAPSGKGCDLCHRNPDPTRIGDIRGHTAECSSCHTTQDLDYHRGFSAKHALTADSAGCLTPCHPKHTPATTIADTRIHGAGCAACHNATLDLTSKTARCTDCHGEGVGRVPTHADYPARHIASTAASQQCTGCHAPDIKDTHARSSLGCNLCHATVAQGGRATCGFCHTPHNPMQNSPLKIFAIAECGNVACHGQGGSVVVTTTADHYAANAAKHAAIPTDATCTDCHSMDLKSAHASVPDLCVTCHTSAKFAARVKPWDRSCEACHATKHAGMAVKHSTSASSACADGAGCHAVTDVTAVHSHVTTVTPAGVTLTNCQVCHVPGAPTPTSAECATCHEPHGDLTASHTPASSANCAACHATDVRAIHAKDALGECAVCHDNPTRVATLPATADCAGCHVYALADGTDHAGYVEKHTAEPGNDACLECHPHQSALVTVFHPYSNLKRPVECRICHNDTVMTPAVKAAKSVACELCHDGPIHAGMAQAHVPSTDLALRCGRCHTPAGQAVDVSVIHTLNGCATCHDVSVFRCTRCHQHGGFTPVAAPAECQNPVCHGGYYQGPVDVDAHYASNAATHTASEIDECTLCHSLDLKTEHDKVTSVEVTCEKCHQAPGFPKPWDKKCASCHPVRHADMDAGHVVSGSQACGDGCHDLSSITALHSVATTITAGGATLKSCQVCHVPGGPAPTSVECATCHSIERLTYHTAMDAKHVSSTSDGCMDTPGCHAATRSLPDVHAPFVGVGKAYTTTCALCHKNKTPGRIIWTQPMDTSCTGTCHGGFVHSLTDHRATSGPSQECVACHGSNLAPTAHGADDTVNRAKCDVCHNRPGGVGDITYQYATSDCENCHADHSPAAAVHYTSKSHESTQGPACDSCHLRSLVPEHTRAVGASFTCLTCHTSAKFAALPAVWDKSCDACHAGARHGSETTAHTSAQASCSGINCHKIGDLTVLHSEADTTVAGIAYTGCSVCHRTPSDQPTSADCTTCHAGHRNLDVAHDTLVSKACVDCHESSDVRAVHARSDKGECAVCHDNPAVPALPATVACIGCHARLSPPDPSHYVETTHTASLQTGAGCSGCHYLSMQAEHKKATVSPAVTCVSCHENEVDLFTVAWAKTCDSCHGTRHGAQAAKHVSNKTACGGSGCHNLADVASIHAPSVSGCAACHKNRDTPATTTDCSASGCHGDITGNHHALHDASASIDAGCKGCHSTYLDDEHVALGLTCATCHSSTNTAVVAAIKGSRRDCAACHPAVNGRNRHAAQNTLEFNKGNSGGHRVNSTLPFMKTSFAVGSSTYSWSAPTNFLKIGWSTTSIVTCDKCHSFATTAAGPHGNTVKVNIDPAYPTDWATVYLSNNGASSTTFICAKCHQNFGSMNNVHGDSDHEGSSDGKCIGCHSQIPHAWRLPRLLAYRDDPAPYNSLYLTGIRVKNYTPTNWSESDCSQSGCDEHSSSMSNRWPSAVQTSGGLKGRVLDTSGVPVAAASVTTDKGQSATTDASGYYDFGSVGVASYSITVAKTGFTSQTKPGAVVTDQTTTVDFALAPVPVNLALGRTFTASRTYSTYGSSYAASNAGDGNTSTYWRSGSLSSSTQIEWLRVDLAAAKSISKAEVVWASSRHATEFRVYVSSDNVTWTQVYATTSGAGGTSTAPWTSRSARYVKVECRRASSSSNGYGIAELRVFN